MSAPTQTAEPETTSEQAIPAPPTKGELVKLDVHRTPDFTQRQTIWSTLPITQKDLLRKKAPKLTDDELAAAMELAAAYKLDPFTSEIWFTKSDSYTKNNGQHVEGKLLIMVGRDGLRKIVVRNNLWMDGDVVRENDVFKVIRKPDGTRTVMHSYENKNRGNIVAAWSIVTLMTDRSVVMGYFYAPWEEYVPKNVSDKSPWSKQKSVMILAAAERQAARQATPLGGLLVEGEDEVINSTVAEGGGDFTEEELRAATSLPERVLELADRASDLNYVGYDIATLEVMLDGLDDENLDHWLANATSELDEFEKAQKVSKLDGDRRVKEVEFKAESDALQEKIREASNAGNEAEAARLRDEDGIDLKSRWQAMRREHERARAEALGEAVPEHTDGA